MVVRLEVRFHIGDFRAIKSVVDSGAIGDVFHVECCMANYGEPSPGWWRSYKDISGGVMDLWQLYMLGKR